MYGCTYYMSYVELPVLTLCVVSLSIAHGMEPKVGMVSCCAQVQEGGSQCRGDIPTGATRIHLPWSSTHLNPRSTTPKSKWGCLGAVIILHISHHIPDALFPELPSQAETSQSCLIWHCIPRISIQTYHPGGLVWHQRPSELLWFLRKPKWWFRMAWFHMVPAPV